MKYFSYLELGLLSLSTLLSFLPPTTFSQSKLEPTKTTLSVLDTDGHQLQTNAKYYIFPIQTGNGGGGLALSAKNFPCPFFVTLQENLDPSNGFPVRFSPADNKQQTIGLSGDVNIVFNAATVCVQSTVWRIGGGGGGNNDGGGENMGLRRYVISNGVMGHPGADTLSSWFKIERNDDHQGGGNNSSNGIGGYKIVFCPSVCGTCKFECGNVGVFRENGKKWLGLNGDEPLVFVFKKA